MIGANILLRLMSELGEMYRQGSIRPIDFITTFDVQELEEAMMYLSSGTRIGKVVVMFENPQSMLKVSPNFMILLVGNKLWLIGKYIDYSLYTRAFL